MTPVSRSFAVPPHNSFAFQPQAVGQWYVNPLTPGVRTATNAVGRLLVHLLHSGAGLTINQMDVTTSVAAGAGGVTRMGVYVPRNQATPFAWTAATVWGDLLTDGGTVATDGATGQKTLTLGTPLVVPANMWFAVGGADQVAAGTRNVGGSAGVLRFSPLGIPATGGYLNATMGLALYMDSVTGALPATFTPAGLSNTDSGVGFRRSA